MLCCGLAACTIAAAALPRNRGRRAAAMRVRRAVAALIAVAASAATASLSVHLDHHRARAAESGRTLLAQVLAAPLCGGAGS